ncbi:MAG: nuclear transport factor 2 family protein [Pseudomonadota bacterium]|nr:nuclear transport factor 2 family protein [Pseudomonadota bacterium]
MEIPAWVRQLFQTIDARDAAAFAAYLAEDGTFRYGSQPVVAGREAVREYVAAFFAGMNGISHELTGFWWREAGEVCFVQGEVTYHLPNAAVVTLPFLNLFRMRDTAIVEYLIYTDPTPLFQGS